MINKFTQLLLFFCLNTAGADTLQITSLPAGNASVTGSSDVFPYVDLVSNPNVTRKLKLSDILNLPSFQAKFISMIPSQTGQSGNCLKTNGTITSWGGCGGAAAVTSVGLADLSTTPIYTISGSPVTSSGTLAFTLNTQVANSFLAGPTTGADAQPTFRALVASDIPSGFAKSDLSNLTSSTAVNAPIVPAVDNSIDLGTFQKSWANFYVFDLVDSNQNTAFDIPGRQLMDPTGTIQATIGSTGVRFATGVLLNGSTSGDITVKAANTTSSYTIKMPSAQGAASTFLQNDGSGALTWSAITSGNLTDAGTDGITVTSGTGAVLGSGTSLSQHVSDTTHNGYLSSTDWTTFNGKQAALTLGNFTDTGTDGITVTSGTGAVVGSGTSIAQHVADSTHNGYLSSGDWSTFNGKQAAGSYAVTTLSNLASTSINQSLLPNAGNTFNLGSASNYWAQGYVSQFLDSTSNVSVDMFNHRLKDSSGTISVDYGSRTLKDSANAIQAQWDTTGLELKKAALFDGSTSGTTTVQAAATTTSHTLTLPSAQGAANSVLKNNGSGALSWGGVGNFTDAGTDGITVTSGTNAVLGSGTSISQHVADTSHNGYLSSTDWNTFNGKQAAGSYANTNLSNLASTAVNVDLLPGVDDSIDAGSAAKRFKNVRASTSVVSGGTDYAAILPSTGLGNPGPGLSLHQASFPYTMDIYLDSVQKGLDITDSDGFGLLKLTNGSLILYQTNSTTASLGGALNQFAGAVESSDVFPKTDNTGSVGNSGQSGPAWAGVTAYNFYGAAGGAAGGPFIWADTYHGFLYDLGGDVGAGGHKVLDLVNRFLMNASEQTTIDFQGLSLIDGSGKTAIDWSGRTGLATDGSTTMFRWSTAASGFEIVRSPLVLDASTSGALTVAPAATTTSYTITMPSAQGAASSVIKNDGSGVLSWEATGAMAYSTASSSYWATSSPTTVKAALDRIAKALSNNGALPIGL